MQTDQNREEFRPLSQLRPAALNRNRGESERLAQTCRKSPRVAETPAAPHDEKATPAASDLLTLAQIARRTPPNGVHVMTIRRWAAPGLADGRKLRTVKHGGRIYSTQWWLEQFLGTEPLGNSQPLTATTAELDSLLGGR